MVSLYRQNNEWSKTGTMHMCRSWDWIGVSMTQSASLSSPDKHHLRQPCDVTMTVTLRGGTIYLSSHLPVFQATSERVCWCSPSILSFIVCSNYGLSVSNTDCLFLSSLFPMLCPTLVVKERPCVVLSFFFPLSFFPSFLSETCLCMECLCFLPHLVCFRVNRLLTVFSNSLILSV